MKRRAPRPQTSSHAAPHNHPANHSRALVRVDGTGIRKKIKKDYEKALRDLENSRRQLDQFHQTDLPQFTRWLNTHFGAEPRLRAALSGNALAQNHRSHDPQPDAV
jgi:hypothetical protein